MIQHGYVQPISGKSGRIRGFGQEFDRFKERADLQNLEHSFATLADNEQWLADNYESTVSSAKHDRPNGPTTLADEEEHVLRCLGAALIMQWNTLPTKLRRELFDDAGSMGELLD